MVKSEFDQRAKHLHLRNLKLGSEAAAQPNPRWKHQQDSQLCISMCVSVSSLYVVIYSGVCLGLARGNLVAYSVIVWVHPSWLRF